MASGPADLRAVAGGLLDGGRFLEVRPGVGFGRLAGHAVGIVGLSEQEVGRARFVRFCDAFEVPLLSLVDATALGAEPAVAARLLYAYAEATVPHLAVVVGRAPSPRLLGADLTLAWPAAGIGDAPDPYAAAERGEVDAVVEPRETRRALVRGLELCRRKTVDRPPRKHGNVPL
jgi:propionyl-CoA carboxylase beta chain